MPGLGTAFGKMAQLEGFVEWMRALPHSHKILIVGNHDYCLYRKAFEYADILKGSGISYLQNSGIEIDGTKFWGSPYTPFFRHMAFENQRDQLADIWAQIPVDTHVLIMHGPPWTDFNKVQDGKHVECEALLDRLDELPELRAHIFGHIHESYGFAVREKGLVKFEMPLPVIHGMSRLIRRSSLTSDPSEVTTISILRSQLIGFLNYWMNNILRLPTSKIGIGSVAICCHQPLEAEKLNGESRFERGVCETADRPVIKQCFNLLAGFGNGISEIGCLDQARCKFYDLHQANKSELAAHVLEYIGQLYQVERETKDPLTY